MQSLGMLTINALTAADEVIIPCSAAYLPVKGLEQLVATIVKVQRRLNKGLTITDDDGGFPHELCKGCG